MTKALKSVLVCLATFGFFNLAAPANGQAEVDTIIFSSNRGGSYDLWAIKEDGTSLRQITSNPLDELQPDVSPDGTRIVFVRTVGISCCGPQMDLIVSNIDGSGERQLSIDPAWDDFRPEWSPDGSKILFSRSIPNSTGQGNLFVINPDGSGMAQVTRESVGINYGSWSPDGTQIVFLRDGLNRSRLWISNSDGSEARALTDGPDFVPAWGPNNRISFHSSREASASELYSVAPDGSDLRRLTNNGFVDRHATWSPDGLKIAFSGLRDLPCSAAPTSLQICPGQLYVMNSDGSGQIRLLPPPFHDAFPVYVPRSAIAATVGGNPNSGAQNPLGTSDGAGTAGALAATGSSSQQLGIMFMLMAAIFLLWQSQPSKRLPTSIGG